MNKTELSQQVAETTGRPTGDVAETLDAILAAVEQELSGGGEVVITGFGKFTVAHRDARAGRNPATGETIQIAASRSPKFSPGAKFKQAIR